MKASEVHLPGVPDYVAQKKTQGCDSVRDWIELRRDETAAAGASTG